MSYFTKQSGTITLSTLGAGSAFTTQINGYINDISLTISKAAGANCSVTITTSSTGQRVLLVKDPTTTLSVYFPRQKAQTSTAGTMASSSPVLNAVADERLKITVATSSAFNAETVSYGIRVGG